MAKANKYQYRIQYVDNTYQIVDWTRNEFNRIADGMKKNEYAVVVDTDVFRISDIRAIVYLPPIPEPTDAEKKAEAEKQANDEWAFVDAETKRWLKNQGMNIPLGGDD